MVREGRDPWDEKDKEKNRKLGDFINGFYWENWLKKKRSGEETKRMLLRHFEPLLKKDMEKLTITKAQHCIDQFKPASQQTFRAMLMATLNFAERREKITRNPLRHWETPEVGDTKPRYLGQYDDQESFNLGERARLFQSLGEYDDWFKYYILLIYLTGMRREETLTLEWKEVSFAGHIITVPAEKNKTGREKVIHLSDDAISILKKWKAICGQDIGLVFASSTGKPRSKTSVSSRMRTLLKRANIRDFTIHSLRKDFAIRALANGVSIYEVAQLLGHSSIKTTEKWYAGLPKPLHLKEMLGTSDAELIAKAC